MIKKFLKDYLSFSKKERVAVIILVCLIFIIFSVPYLLPSNKENFNDAAFAKFRQEASQLRVDKNAYGNSTPESTRASLVVPGLRGEYPSAHKGENAPKPELFYFDPNTLAFEGWKKLGLPDRNIRTIQNYLSKGGKFRKAEDLEKIYGLLMEDVAPLKPFVRIRSLTAEYPPRKPEQKNRYEYRSSLSAVKTPPPLVDLNLGDTSALISLPGIGSKLASRIIRFREKLGGFYAVEQLAEVYGLPDSTFQKIKNLVTLSSTGEVKKINVNTVTLQDMQEHPYLRGTPARLIFEYRGQHGRFTTLDELHQLETITPELFDKLHHYLTVTEKP